MKKNIILTFLFFILVLIGHQNTFAQAVITCQVDGKEFKGVVKESVQVSLGKEVFIQIKCEENSKIMYLYLKASKLNGVSEAKLEYTPYDEVTKQAPNAEVVWVPDGPEQPSWNTIEGNAQIASFDPNAKTLTGTFDFVVEKDNFGSKAKPESIKISNGKFENLQYKIEEKKGK